MNIYVYIYIYIYIYMYIYIITHMIINYQVEHKKIDLGAIEDMQDDLGGASTYSNIFVYIYMYIYLYIYVCM
jgi:hypothetical protein